jgi:hypothetical protein
MMQTEHVVTPPTAGDAASPHATYPALKILPSDRAFPEVRLVDPVASGFALIAAEVDHRPGPLFLWASRRKRRLISECKRLCDQLKQRPHVLSATVFRALVAPPGGRGPYVRRRGASIHLARFDVVILIETESLKAAEDLRAEPRYQELDARVRHVAHYVYVTTATNVKRMGPVDHSRGGVFLFNYFVADRPAQNIAVWHYTAGWFQQETCLDNSTVLLPAQPDRSGYTLINHCRWDRLRNVLPRGRSTPAPGVSRKARGPCAPRPRRIGCRGPDTCVSCRH